MMKYKSLSLVIALVCFSTQIFAHAPWIETNATGTKGKSQEVKIFFGEFADKSISPASKWFSDLKNFTLVLITPSKKEISLLSTAADSYYTTQFTPEENGVYTIVMHHTVKDTYSKMKLDYNSSATVFVGSFNGSAASIVNKNIVSLVADSAFDLAQNRQIKIQALYNGLPASKKEIKVFAPNGWARELHSNEKGEAIFMPLWAGKYMVEYSYVDKTPGEHNGKKYDELWQVATYMITVN